MASLQRFVVSPACSSLPPGLLWRGVGGVLVLTALFTLRACDYDFGMVARYAAYIAAYVALPGVVALSFVHRGPLSLTQVIALALPTGFALEIFSFLGLSAIGAKAAYAWMPVAWAALAIGLGVSWRRWPVRMRISGHHAGVCLGLGVAFLGTAIMAASQMFAESPLAEGLPTRAIFHDWVYLISRAGVIKNNWPLDDPSLSGTPLQYHYFMMVHAAAASWTTGVEISAVMLRLLVVPLGAVLVGQAYALGRAVSRSAWGGVLAALLTVVASEVSFAESYGKPMFLGLFVRWLFVSPTFFFGMIFCGALLLAIGRGVQRIRCDLRHGAWLVLLGTAGTGAKGTLLPVIVCALGLWALWRWRAERRVPWRIVSFAGVLTLAFAVVYLPTMSAWRTGDARLRPFHVFQLTDFWQHYLPLWQAWLTQGLPKPVADSIATLLCASVVFAGTCGVRLLAVPYLFWGELDRRDSLLVGWLGSFFLASAGMGLLLELNSYGELYVILMMRLPTAVLTAAFFIAALRRLGRNDAVEAETASETMLPARRTATSGRRLAWSAVRTRPEVALHLDSTACLRRLRRWREELRRAAPAASAAASTDAPVIEAARAATRPRLFVAAAIAVLGAVLAMQTSLWFKRNSHGFTEWLRTPTDLRPDDYMRNLQEALLWVRHHTEPNAVLVANACTPENMRKDHWGALDRTLMGVHFYYSALSERRLWFEGPNYLLDATRARIRAGLASNFFYRGRALDPALVNAGPCYALIDRSLQDGAKVRLPVERRVFSNQRIDIFRISGTPEPPAGRVALTAAY